MMDTSHDYYSPILFDARGEHRDLLSLTATTPERAMELGRAYQAEHPERAADCLDYMHVCEDFVDMMRREESPNEADLDVEDLLQRRPFGLA